MKYLRRIVIGSSLLLAASVYFWVNQATNQSGSVQGKEGQETSSSSPAPDRPTALAQRTASPQRPSVSIPHPASTNLVPSSLALKNFPNGKILQNRLEEIAPNQFRRTELIETDLKYPFIRLETVFRQEGDKEVLIGRHEVAADHVSVELKAGATEAELLAEIGKIGGIIRKKLNLEYAETYLIGLPAPTIDAVPSAIEHLRAFPNIIAKVDGDGVSRRAGIIPNDTRFQHMWHLHNTGQSGGTVDADIDASEAWGLHTGDQNMLVAISDTGVNYNHNDLTGSIWTNKSERDNELDDDRNGYNDDTRGWNFYDGNKDVLDQDGHGTFVAGIIGARANNGRGVSGMSWNCQLMIIRVLDTSGGFNSDIAEGFDYARKKGAKIINASHGGTGSSVLQSAVDNLEASGILLVAAAGNYGEDTDSIPLHPASYPNQNVISVAATDRNDNLSSFSSYGAVSVDLAAPGSGIYSTTMDNSYETESGTSFSTPLVTGVAALVLAQNPSWDCFRVRTRILNNVDRIPSLEGKMVTGGRLNAFKALLPKTTIPDALDGSFFSWNNAGTTPWVGQKVIAHDGVDAAETGKAWHGRESRLSATVTGPGRMYFWWKVSSEPNYDRLIFSIDGYQITAISGETGWTQYFYNIPAGTHTLAWSYVKDESVSAGTDNGFLDEVTFLGVPPAVVTQPQGRSVFAGTDVTLSVNASGTSPMSYQWLKAGTPIAGATRSALALGKVQPSAAGNYSVFISNVAGSTTSAAATLTVCNVALSTSSAVFGPEGGNGSFAITMTGNCSWQVQSTNAWISFNSPASGTGNTTFQLSVSPNESSVARAGFLTIGNRRFLIRQSGNPAPESVLGRTFSMTVTNSTGALSASGTASLIASSNGEFHMVPLTDGIAADAGTFSYLQSDSNTGMLVLNGSTPLTVTLDFTSPVRGTFTVHNAIGNTQSGYFNTRRTGLDFNNDRRNDLLLQNTKGILLGWCLQGTNLMETVPLRNRKPAATGWRVMAATDLMETPEAEIILQGANGQLAAWCMTNGTNFVKAVFLREGTPLGAGWRVAGAADFNQDGKADLLLQHQDTRSAVWYMDGTNFLGARHLRDGFVPGIGWRICGVSDFDRDGQTDVLWQHQDGRLQVWHLVASDFVAVSNLRTAGVPWKAVAIHDFDEDGNEDILFQHADRRLAIWYMDGTAFIKAVLFLNGQPLGSALRIAAPK